MTSLLIVDDETTAIRAVQGALEWSKYGITEIFTAQSMKQAQAVFSKHTVDIMLSDIEMPRGSGLQLLEWVRHFHSSTECVFLTCHADFHFSQKAIQLGSLDYLLKPVPKEELEVVILKAMDKISREVHLQQINQSWMRNQTHIKEKFWLDVIQRRIPSDDETIRRAARERNLVIQESKMVPILIKVKRWLKPLTTRDERVMEYALRNAVEEVLIAGEVSIIGLEKGTLAAIVLSSSNLVESGLLYATLQDYVSACHRYFYCDLCCYIGESSTFSSISVQFDMLSEQENRNVAYDNKVFTVEEKKAGTLIPSIPDMRIWSALITDGKTDVMLGEATHYLDELSRAPGTTAELLHRFHHDFLQMMYSLLREKGILANQLFQDVTSREIFQSAVRSVTDMIGWIQHVTSRTVEYLTEESDSIVDKVKRYIQANLERNITREDIANHVYLNPDYLTRLIKKETGLLISNYILMERMKLAEKLLTQTDMTVKAVARKVGYVTISHFTKVFQKYHGKTPSDFRDNRRK
ncbi:hypothetical protein BK133_01255 [Paenibacillus sp. FSL H8-0548]|uniref:response regulator n=1 Tax=Paenibacillus sp. FSL H8-0548 TaxID=1920422 RepID=UPI00096F6FF2|nr:response regulator [Paenibacillus sp. FSL H8-0548]OMF38856.1 hypothetical protein BK133_01255 [Paenibacillus sp. FSL H8-0548]